MRFRLDLAEVMIDDNPELAPFARVVLIKLYGSDKGEIRFNRRSELLGLALDIEAGMGWR